MQARSSLIEKVKRVQGEDPKLCKLRDDAKEGNVLWFEDSLCVPNVESIRREVLEEAHKFSYMVHPETSKMYQDLK